MTADASFTEGDTHALLVRALDRDAGGVAAWMRQCIVRHRDMHALCEVLCRVISTTWPMALTRGTDLAPGDYWVLDDQGEPDPASVAAAQMIAATGDGLRAIAEQETP